ncbi:hypothetical protein FHX42_000786 [Saccharopolyspora lacisalsi]|uniref:DUF2567 domain-containing protein n=1 Tax=Halosaccharopolyspora lacisalsi TaxID=1000566 RepID=A0A839DVL3_9PSEU|nr:DUF2567 domain-containing protein [Halosaccharopolyspora lacisalsi]MBA8823457.1 hypothetical protein [Halosaccharopolyspora lacisalsi]
MPEGPVEAHEGRDTPPQVAGSGDGTAAPAFWSRQTPRVVVKADLLPALIALVSVSLLGVPLGWLWSRLAPAHASVLTSGGELSMMPVESYHRFDALAVFLLITASAGVLLGALLWLVRSRRGPVVLVAGVLGSLACAWLASKLGTMFAGGLHPMPAEPQVGELITMPPEIDTPSAVLLQPFALALVYGLATSWNALDDLGRRE